MPRESSQREHRLAPTKADPLAALRICGVAVTLPIGGFMVPAVPAATWLEILLAEDFLPEAVFPRLCGPEAVMAVYDGILEGAVDETEISEAVTDILEAVSGRRWWITLRLARVAREHWDTVGGALTLAGIRPDQVSLGAWMDAAYALMIERMANADPKAAAQFTQTLVAPPPGVLRAELDDVAEGNAFLASMRMAR